MRLSSWGATVVPRGGLLQKEQACAHSSPSWYQNAISRLDRLLAVKGAYCSWRVHIPECSLGGLSLHEAPAPQDMIPLASLGTNAGTWMHRERERERGLDKSLKKEMSLVKSHTLPLLSVTRWYREVKSVPGPRQFGLWTSRTVRTPRLGF